MTLAGRVVIVVGVALIIGGLVMGLVPSEPSEGCGSAFAPSTSLLSACSGPGAGVLQHAVAAIAVGVMLVVGAFYSLDEGRGRGWMSSGKQPPTSKGE
ncbi:hypothetical protein [Allonocardiopsis opalescens]|uniref:hypothetical protein n=1 Tax=Allonocardiopsis opalescens TaxID=1144618 RepID=UPI0011B26736|nr:hypothetical protein [Allonocardiopsis opalescens]